MCSKVGAPEVSVAFDALMNPKSNAVAKAFVEHYYSIFDSNRA